VIYSSAFDRKAHPGTRGETSAGAVLATLR